MIPNLFIEIGSPDIIKQSNFSMDPSSLQKIVILNDLAKKEDGYKKYFKDQYPETSSCIELDKQISSIQSDINEIEKRELSKKNECNCKEILFNYKNYKFVYANSLRSKSKVYLEQMLLQKKNLVALADCRNQIETIRQTETAQVFTETSAKAETRVLTDTKKKQYLLIGVGAVAVLTVVYLVVRKK